MKTDFMKKPMIWAENSLGSCGISQHPPIYGISFDSRTIEPGDIFFALNSHRDGHDFVKDAIAKGACCAIVERTICEKNIVVDSVMGTLIKIANLRRSMFNGIVIGITGSVGKTTAKQMITKALLKAGKKVFATPKSYNNLLGLSYSLAILPLEAEFAILELGISKPGDMEEIAQLSQLDYSLITEIGPAHISNFGSLKAIALEKGNIIKYTKFCTVFNKKKWYANIFESMALNAGIKHAGFGYKETMLEQSKAAWQALLDQIAVHHASWSENELNSISGRRDVFSINNQVDIIDAAYNASLPSMIESLKFLKNKFHKKKVAILGDMIFLDDRAKRYHEFLHCYLDDISLLCVGPSMKFLHNKKIASGGDSQWFESVNDLLKFLSQTNLNEVAILIKGSSDANRSVYDLKPVVEYFLLQRV